jgi:hypothetical protein
MKMTAEELRSRGNAAGILYADGVAALIDSTTAIGKSVGVSDPSQMCIDIAAKGFSEDSPELCALVPSARDRRIYNTAAKAAFCKRIGEVLLVAPAGSPNGSSRPR